MHPLPPIFLGVDPDSSLVDVVVWVIAGVIWLLAQIGSARKKQARKAQQAQAPRPTAPAAGTGGGESPSPGELAEIFRRLGANIPNTPEPPISPRPAPSSQAAPPPPPPTIRAPPARKPVPRTALRRPAGPVAPELAARLARAKQEAAEAARLAEAERIAVASAGPSVQSRGGEHRALDTATRHTGMILPRVYAMGLRLAPLPILPMPGFDRTHHAGAPLVARLRTRRELREAIVAQIFLRSAKSVSP